MTLRILLGVAPSLVSIVLAVLFTYALHAVVWCAAVLAALTRKAASAPSVRHRLWKLALVGPCATAPIAALVPWTFGRTLSPPVLSLAGASAAAGVGAGALAPHLGPSWMALAFAVAAGLGLVRFALAFIGLRRRLRTRTAVRDARALRLLDRICARAQWSAVTLTESAAIGSPLVIGTRELCVPGIMLQQLGEAELAAVLGHELGHLERRDGVWFPVAGLLQSVLWMQPLNHWIASRFRETAELACDDRAVELTGDRLGLARALVRVAESAFVANEGALAPTVARSASALRSRVQRLTASTRLPPRAARALEPARAFASVGVCAIASLGASVRVGHGPATAAVLAPSSERLEALVRRDLELQRQVARAESWSEAWSEDRNAPALAARRAALEQELRHVRAEATWLEQRLNRGAAPECAFLSTN